MRRLLTLSGGIELSAAANGPKRLAIVAYSGGWMQPAGWGDVAIDLAGLRLPASFPILADHRNELNAVLGAGTARVEGGRLLVAGDLADSDAARELVALLERVALQASVTVRVEQRSYAEAGATVEVNGRTLTAPRDATIITASELAEVSILPLAADRKSEVTIAARRRGARHGGEKMRFSEWLRTQGKEIEERYGTATPERRRMLLAAAVMDDIELDAGERDELLQAGAAAPQDAGDRLRATAATFVRGGADRDIVRAKLDEALDGGWTPARLSAEIELAGPRGLPLDNRPRSTPAISREVLAAGVLMMVGHRATAESAYGAQACERAADLDLRGVRDLAGAICRANGRPAPRDVDELLRASAGPSTYSLPVALGDAANKIALGAYSESPATWRSWCRVASVRDFRAHHMLRTHWQDAMERIAPGGEVKHGTIGEADHTIQADTFGRIFALDRRDLVNDDLGVLAEAPAALGRLGARALSNLVYQTLLANADDFFVEAGHANLLTTATSALGVESLSAAIAGMRKQTDATGAPIDLVPRTLLVPPELEGAARSILRTVTLARDTQSADNLATGSPIAPDLALEIEPRISADGFHEGASDSLWFLFASPRDGAMIVAFLNGAQQPQIVIEPSPTHILGMTARGIFDYGVAFGDYRAAVRADGK